MKVLSSNTSTNYSSTTDRVPFPFFCLFLFYIVVWWLQLGERLEHRFGTHVRIEAIVVAVLLVYTAIDSFRKSNDEKAGFFPFILLFLFAMLFRVVFAYKPNWAWYIFYERVLKYSVMGLLIARFVRSTQDLKWLIGIWLISCWKGTLEGVIGGITGSLVWENQGIMRLHGVGLWSHPNSFSQFALGPLPFCIYLFPVLKNWAYRLVILSLVVFSSYVVLYTGSRTGYLGYILLLILTFFKLPEHYKRIFVIIFIMLAIMAVVFVPPQYKERFRSIYSGKEKEGHSKQSRILLYKNGFKVFIEHPFGVGICNYRFYHEKRFGRAMDQHCLYTEALSEIGIQGFVAFLLLLLKIDKVLRNNLEKIKYYLANSDLISNEKFSDLNILMAVTKSTQIYFWLRLFLDIFGMDLYGITWWFVIGIASSITYIINHEFSDLQSVDIHIQKIHDS